MYYHYWPVEYLLGNIRVRLSGYKSKKGGRCSLKIHTIETEFKWNLIRFRELIRCIPVMTRSLEFTGGLLSSIE